jgi:hypothetical protein
VCLPEALRVDLIKALQSLDSVRIDTVIGQVAKHDKTLQKKLSRLAENFDYPSILRALRMDGQG